MVLPGWQSRGLSARPKKKLPDDPALIPTLRKYPGLLSLIQAPFGLGPAQALETAHQHAGKEPAGRGQVFQPRGELQEPANGGAEFVPLEGHSKTQSAPASSNRGS